jgi:preprotein translocase subunit YajC
MITGGLSLEMLILLIYVAIMLAFLLFIIRSRKKYNRALVNQDEAIRDQKEVLETLKEIKNLLQERLK